MLSGRCACGIVRYRLASAPYDCGWCHCRICQLVSGSAGLVFATVSRDAFIIERGSDEVGEFPSTIFGQRSFCRTCGSPLTIHVEHQTDEIEVTVGTLDEPSSIFPGFHLFVSEAPSWLQLDDGLPCFEKLRPSTRGLKPGQTEI